MNSKQGSDLYFQAGELLRDEARQIAETLLRLARDASDADWKNAAWNVVGGGQLQWPTRLIENLTAHQSKRLAEDGQIARLRTYVEQRRKPEADLEI
jgi:hypothetical protein